MAKTRIEKISEWVIKVGILFFIFSFFLFIYKQKVFDLTRPIDNDRFSDFGAFVAGTVGVMWSLASLLLVYSTLRVQKAEIEANRTEAMARIEQLSKQNDQFTQERVEATFFQLLSSHHILISHIEIRDPTANMAVIRGRDCFSKLYNIFKTVYYSIDEVESSGQRIAASYTDFIEKYQEALGSYFRNLYNVFKFIHNSSIDNKRQYTNLIRAQLSNNELLLLFYNCLSERGVKFKSYVCCYHLFDNINVRTLIDKGHKDLYPLEAFGG